MSHGVMTLHKAALQNETVRFYSQPQNAAARSDVVHAVQGKSKHLCEIETKGEIFYVLSKAQVGPFYEKNRGKKTHVNVPLAGLFSHPMSNALHFAPGKLTTVNFIIAFPD